MLPASLYKLLLVALRALVVAQDTSQFDNSSLLWGPYRPNLYFGVRPRIPKTLLMGLMWANVDTHENIPRNLRHTCEQNEGMAGYGWISMTRDGGVQEINDPVNKVNLTTEFTKIPGGAYGGNWGVRVKGIPRADAPADLHTTLIFYIGLESGSGLQCIPSEHTTAEQANVQCKGSTSGLGSFNIQFPASSDSGQMWQPKTRVKSLVIPDDTIWEAKSIFTQNLKAVTDSQTNDASNGKELLSHQLLMLEDDPGIGNMHFIQKTFQGVIEFDVLFSSDSAPSPINSRDLEKAVERDYSSFSQRFKAVFGSAPRYGAGDYAKFSQALLSNLVGGMGYFYGDWKVGRSNASPKLADPTELYSMVPSRPFFPRGFLWDEGFHLLVLLDWDIDMALEVTLSWFALIDEDGWIAREQILGSEARSKVPSEFQVQSPDVANPPTLFLVLAAFVDRLSGNVSYAGATSQYLGSPDAGRKLLKHLYPLLRRHYEWFRRTQAGDLKSPDYHRPLSNQVEGYRWRGGTSRHILSSGLDDYPRAQPPHFGELHLDAMSWVGSMAGAMQKISEFLGENEKTFEEQAAAVKDNIDILHWSKDNELYCDATIEDGDHVHVCHKGYISLFPFLLGLLGRDHIHLASVLNFIHDEAEIWSPYGLRSLSRASPLYGSEENYWRSPVWININYLAIERLLDLAQHSGPHQQKARVIYTDLRHNIISTVYNSWRDTGFAWEQYNPENGAGQRTQHFTGWTALVVKIMAFPDLVETPTPIWDQPDNNALGWNRMTMIMVIVLLAVGVVFRRKLMLGWRRAMGWSRIRARD